jgi:endonuclease-3
MKAAQIMDVLSRLYPNPPVPLNNYDTFTFLVSVVLSAQTTDGKVNEVTRTLFKHGPTPYKMSCLEPSFVQSIIQSVGLAPKKASYIIDLSKALVDRFQGEVPSTFEELESLPGVGHKTASVVMSQSFGVPAFAVDTHVHRLALRWNISKNEKNVNIVQKDLCEFFPRDQWNKVNFSLK